MSDLTSNLNDEQKEAVETLNGPLLVIAGAGSGKTRVVTCRIANLLQNGIEPSKILGLTFTNKAAAEMQERVKALTHSFVLVSTFHSLGVRILRESIQALGGYTRSFTIYDSEDSEKLLRMCLGDLLGPDAKKELKALRGMISNAKNSWLHPQDISESERTPAGYSFAGVYQAYQSKLREYNAVDFDDLLFLTVRLFREHPAVLEHYQNRWSHMMIDEYQDTNAVQYEMVNLLVSKSKNLCVVGDPDQSIYSWRGANIRNILDFDKDYPGAKVVRLDQNYRSSNNILNAANALIARNDRLYEKKLWSNLGPGEKITLYTADTERTEARFIARKLMDHNQNQDIPFNQMVVFYRTNAQSRAFEDHFLQCRIPYSVVGGVSFYQRREIKDVLALLRMVQSGADFVSFERTINLPKRGIGPTTIDKIRIAATQEECSILTFCEKLLTDRPLVYTVKLSAKQKEGLKDYVNMILILQETMSNMPLGKLVSEAVERSRYKDYLAEDKETYEDRWENVNSLIAKAWEWEDSTTEPTLEAFLEELSLKSTLDETESSDEKVSLMTIHNGKGLEFSVACLAGLEEDLFPHANSRDSETAQEEERRLCYVGVTRAKRFLYLTNCTTRFLWGVTRAQRPSRFIYEIPKEYIQRVRD